MTYHIDDNGKRVAVDPALFGVAPTPPQRAKRLEDTQELYVPAGAGGVRSRAKDDPAAAGAFIQDNDDNDRSTYMLVMVITWVIYFVGGVALGAWLW